MKAALLQLCSSDDPAANLTQTLALVQDAARQGAMLISTPEVTNCVSLNRAHQQEVLQTEGEDLTLAGLRKAATDLGIWLHIGSLALATEGPLFANRSFLIRPDGSIAARYDKIHMFDVEVSKTETFRESDGYQPGAQAVVAPVDDTALGLTICYDLRFAYLYRALAKAGAQVLMIPAAFSPVTGAAHWEPLLRTRAIETGCFVLAAAQTGTHPSTDEKVRKTYGHSMVVAPWGEVLLDAGEAVGAHLVDLDLSQVAEARRRVPALTHDRPFEGP